MLDINPPESQCTDTCMCEPMGRHQEVISGDLKKEKKELLGSHINSSVAAFILFRQV